MEGQEAGGEPRSGAPHKPRRGASRPGPPAPADTRSALGPETPSGKKAQTTRGAPLSCTPAMGPEPPTPGLQSQAESQPKGSIGSESIPPSPLTPGASPQRLPRASLGGPAHTCRALWPSRRPGRPCPESPSFLSQSSRDPRRPHPRREKSRGQGGAARTQRDTGAGNACARPTPPRAVGAAASCRPPPRTAGISPKQPPRPCW